ncbi:hypothetical protein KC906_03975 [Candidatus Kaiserbacteria bacterium]|nr:hypothetical protein [Candidatus Kaiserbacteria bacterium]
MRKPQYSLLGQLFGFRDDGTPMLPQAANDPTFHFVGMGFMVPPMIERVYGEQGAKRYRYRLMLEWRKATKE